MKILVVVDMQNDFITGSLGTKEAQTIVPNVKKKIEETYKNKGYVFFTRDTHDEDYLDTLEGKKLPVPHCLSNSWGWEITEDIRAKDNADWDVINKTTFGSIYLGTLITSYANYGNVDEIELIGLCTDICVISNAIMLKAKFPNIPIVVDASCCAGVTPQSHKNALEAMKMCQIDIIGEQS